MRRWPSLLHPEDPPLDAPLVAGDGQMIEPWLASGGATFFLLGGGFDPRPEGVQLVASMYVPRGSVGFVKEIRIAPFMPPVLADPWETSGITNAITTWRSYNIVLDNEPRAAGTHGVWATPFGWESYFDSADIAAFPPQWVWHLRGIRGDIRNRVQYGLPDFSIADAASWFLVPNVPVPISAYASGIPGNQLGKTWGPQRMQVLQGDKLSTHVLVPEDTTVALFAQWKQGIIRPVGVIPSGEGQVATQYGPDVYPLLPSFGQLHGYMQTTEEAAYDNAHFGWGG